MYFSTPLTSLLFNIICILNLSDNAASLFYFMRNQFFSLLLTVHFIAKVCLLPSAHAGLLLFPITILTQSFKYKSSFFPDCSTVTLPPLLLLWTHFTSMLLAVFPVFYFSSPIRLKEDFHFSSFVKERVGVGDHRSIFILVCSFALLQLPCKTVHVGNTSQVSYAVSSWKKKDKGYSVFD